MIPLHRALSLRSVVVALSLAATAAIGQPKDPPIDLDGGSPQKQAEAPKDLPQDPRIDSDTGRQIARWRPSPEFDYQHMRLELDFPDLGAPELVGRETLRARAMGKSRNQMRLDAKKIHVRSVMVGRQKAAFESDDRELVIHLPSAVPAGGEVEVVIDYDVNFGYCKGQGLTWSSAKPDATIESDRFPQIHSQGEAEDNSRWFCCHDYPNEKLTTEVIATVEDGYEVSSNGKLVSREPAGKGRTRWHWLQDTPHANYLVTLVIGKFSVVELGGADSARPGLSMPVYTPIGTEDDARRLYQNTPAMIAYFEKIFDEPYPWARYAQVICRDFVWGGMENTSATTMTRGSLRGEDGSQDSLISHELAHQWFGDLVTCKGWEHLWLNEGWASYCEALWDEEAAGKDLSARRKAYQRSISRFMAGQKARNSSYAPDYPALVSNRYKSEDEVMAKPDDVYGKGALVLHMLRMRLGDDAFFKGTRLYLDRFKYKHATSDDFRRALEDVSGQSLDRFFTQWTLRPGLPKLGISYDFDASSSRLKISVEQTQTVDVSNPAYAFSLPFYVRYEGGDGEYVYFDMDTRSASEEFEVRGKPASISVDPRLTVAASHDVVKDLPGKEEGQ